MTADAHGPDDPAEAGAPGAKGATRTYGSAAGAVVDWNATRCLHVAACLRTAPAAFDTRRRPWVQLDAAPPEQVAAAVRACPTGALRLRDDDALPPEPQVEVRPDGPLYVTGRVRVVQDDVELERGARTALCRCGATGNAPWCDGSHRAVGFRSGTPVQREAPPAELSGDVTVTVTGGPLVVEGAPVTAPGGAVLHAGGRCSLCRCGRSSSKPFCDGSHARDADQQG